MSEYHCPWCSASGVADQDGDFTYACGSWTHIDMHSQSHRCLFRERNQIADKLKAFEKGRKPDPPMNTEQTHAIDQIQGGALRASIGLKGAVWVLSVGMSFVLVPLIVAKSVGSKTQDPQQASEPVQYAPTPQRATPFNPLAFASELNTVYNHATRLGVEIDYINTGFRANDGTGDEMSIAFVKIVHNTQRIIEALEEKQ